MVQRIKDSPSSLAFTSTSVEVLLKQINAFESEIKSEFLAVVNCQTSGKDQLAILKKIGTSLREKGNVHKNEDVRVLASMFFHCGSQHPMRRSLSSMLQNLNDDFRKEFNFVITELFEFVLQYDNNCGFDAIRENIDTICSLMENFPAGDQVIRENHKLVLHYLDKSLESFFNATRSESNPVDQTKTMQHLLSTLKTIIAVFQKVEVRLIESNVNNTREESTYVKATVINSIEIMCCEVATLECRCAAAMIFPALFAHLPPQSRKEFAEILNHGYFDAVTSEINQFDSRNSLLNAFDDRDFNNVTKILLLAMNNLFARKLELSSKLVLLHGLLVKLPEDVLHMEFSDGHTLFTELFISELIDISLKSSAKNVLVLSFKTILLLIDRVHTYSSVHCKPNAMLSQLTGKKILPHLLLYVDHHIDTIRHTVNAAIKASFTILSPTDMERMINNCINEYFNGTLRYRGQILMLINISQFISIEKILSSHEDLPEKILSLLSDVDLAAHGCNLYVVMCEKHWNEIVSSKTSVKDWMNVWIDILSAKLCEKDKEIKSNIVNIIIPSILKFNSDIVQIILSDMNTNPQGGKVRAAIVFLRCLRGMKNHTNKTGILFDASRADLDTNKDILWKGMLKLDDLKKCLTHLDNQVRLDALSLICSSIKTTDPFDNEDIQLFQHFISYNMNCESPSFRHQLTTNLKKVCFRLFNHAFQLSKQISNDGTSDGSISNTLHMYGEFLVWLTRFFFKKLHEYAPYSQISTTLGCISLITEIFHTFKSSELFRYYHLDETEKQNFTNQLIETFSDTYDPNRVTVIEVFKCFPVFCTYDHIDIAKIFKGALDNLTSPQPDVSSIAAYYITFLALIIKEEEIELLGSILTEHGVSSYHFLNDKSNPTLVFLGICLSFLKKKFEVMNTNLIKGCQDAPLYGFLFCIRMLFQLQDVNLLKSGLVKNDSGDLFTSFLEDLIETSLGIINLVSPYVSNDAPEGYLCDVDLFEIFKLLNLDDVSKGNIEVEAQVARMLLVSCWRSMKEVSLLIGIIVSHFSHLTSKSTNYNFLSVSYIIKIWTMFCDILLRSKHAGAYELASIGFVKLCSVLWSSYDDKLRSIPAEAVVSLVNDLLDPVPFDKAQVTRRSAGLPFYLEALCITEPEIKDKQSFKLLMGALTELCEYKMLEHDVNKLVISLNILRAFYKNTKLREDVFPYVSSGIVISINGFASSKWAIRNSCTLLFSALMQRVFGVKKCKMTGREFFSKFPLLYTFLLDQLKSIDSHVTESSNQMVPYGSYHPSLFPVLLLLSHLYPSTIEASNSLMQLDKFIPYVMSCGSNAVYKTRTMAAKALVPLISLDKLQEMMSKLISQIKSIYQGKESTNQNFIHGCLLHLKFVSERCILSDSCGRDLKEVFESFLSIRCYCLDSHAPCIIQSLFIDILLLFLQNGYKDDIFCALPLSHQCLLASTTNRTNSSPGYPLLLRSATRYIHTLFIREEIFSVEERKVDDHSNCKSTDIHEICQLFLKSNEFDVICGILEIIQTIPNRMMSPKLIEVLLTFIANSSVKDRYFSKALDALTIFIKDGHITSSDLIEQMIFKIFENQSDSFSDELKTSVARFCVMFLSTLDHPFGLKTNENSNNVLEKIWKFLDQSSQSNQCESCREETALVLGMDPDLDDTSILQQSHLYHYFNCCISLLKDSALQIRDVAAEGISSILCDINDTDEIWYVPQPSFVIKQFFKEKLGRQLERDSNQCTIYLFSLILGIDYFKLNTTLNNGAEISNSIEANQATTDDEEILKRFVVYEEGKENPYYDEKEICELSYNILKDFYITCDETVRTSCCTILDNVRIYANIFKSDIGWNYLGKLKEILMK